MDLGLTGRTALVVGSTSGLGLAVARSLATEGVRVGVLGRRTGLVREVAGSLPGAVGLVANVTDPDSRADAIATARQQLGRVDVLVLNGGGPPPSLARDLSATMVDAAVAALVQPHVDLVEAFLPDMTEAGWGRIIAIGSSGVQQPLPDLAASNVGRAALAGYLKTLAAEVAAEGVTVNMVLPGRFDTDRVRALDQSAARSEGTDADLVRSASIATIPTGRYGDAEEFAAVVTFLASARASYVTGEQVRCDGGLVRHH